MGNAFLFPASAQTYTAKDIDRLFWVPSVLGSEDAQADEMFPTLEKVEEFYRSYNPISNTGVVWFPCHYITASTAVGSKHLILYFHGNSCDMGDMVDEMTEINHYTGHHIVQMEYPGYGICKHMITQPHVIDEWARSVARLLLLLKMPPQSLIIMGRSIGTGPAARLALWVCEHLKNRDSPTPALLGGTVIRSASSAASASSGEHKNNTKKPGKKSSKENPAPAAEPEGKAREDSSESSSAANCAEGEAEPKQSVGSACASPVIGGLIIHSGYTSIHAIVKEYASIAGTFLVPNYWDTKEALGRLSAFNVPLLVIHGVVDEVIPVSHGRELLEAYKGKPKLGFFSPVSEHNSYMVLDDIVRPLGVLLGKAKPDYLQIEIPSFLVPRWSSNFEVKAPAAALAKPAAINTIIDHPLTKLLFCGCAQGSEPELTHFGDHPQEPLPRSGLFARAPPNGSGAIRDDSSSSDGSYLPTGDEPHAGVRVGVSAATNSPSVTRTSKNVITSNVITTDDKRAGVKPLLSPGHPPESERES